MKKQSEEVGGPYANYVLIVLMIVYIFNFIDRNILSILAEDIKADLGISDSQMGFLYGTVFAVFYAVFGIPLARFADVWTRRTLISVGLGFWSLMTAASGLARSFPVLTAFRIGVGVGEASASPSAYSMLSDYYPRHLRATVIAIYGAGLYIGAGIGVFLGGFILDWWASTYPTNPPFGLRGWQAAFLVVGLPGLGMAIWVRTLREPQRGMSEGLVSEPHPAPFRLLAEELMTVIPPFNLKPLLGHRGALRKNLVVGALCGLLAAFLIWLTGSVAQWTATAIGAYITFSWTQNLKLRDPATYAMMFHSRAFNYTMLAFPMIAFVGYGAGFWIPPLLLRMHDVSATSIGLYIGLGSALGGFIGITLGGVLADYLKTRFPSGRMVLGYICILGVVPLLLLLLYTESMVLAFWINFFLTIPAACGASVPPTTASDLVMPRMRAVAGAYYILVNTFVGLALGPYAIGQISDVLNRGGMNDADALRSAIGLSMLIFIPALFFLYLAQKHLPEDEASRLDRAHSLGESVETG
ncbi:MAG: MFS transporter [Myxococcota bacterium]|nr:MFS transporter [Myxococcota bacterium]